MAIISTAHELPPMPGHPFPTAPFQGQYSDVIYRGVSYEEDSQPVKGIVFYFHGSGANAPLNNGALVQDLTQAGYRVVSITMLNHGNSTPSGFRYGYGNVNDPDFTSLFIKTAWWVATVMSSNLKDGLPYMIVGHSMGASATLSYLAHYAQQPEVLADPNYKGAILNGATVGGTGDFSWNDVSKNLAIIGGMVSLIEPGKRLLLCYTDNDAYCPPDYAKRVQTMIPTDADVYITSPGAFGHSWMNSTNSWIVKNWVEQLYNDQPLLTASGKPMKKGPV